MLSVIAETRELADGSDAEMQELVEQELAELETRRDDLLPARRVRRYVAAEDVEMRYHDPRDHRATGEVPT